MLARAGAPVTLIGRRHHVEAMARDGLLLESLHFRERLRVTASTEVAAACNADLVLFCVKTLDTEEAARMLAAHLTPETVVISLQNGVDNTERIRSVINNEVVPAVVYVGAEMTALGCVKHTARGDLILGDLPRRDPADSGRRQWLESLAATFVRAGVPCRVSDNIEGDLWTKLIINCAYNAMSALTRSRYGRIAAHPLTRDLIRQVVEEAVAVARAAGVQMPDVNMVEVAWKLADSMPGTLSSTAQDISRGKVTEIDSLNGYVARRGVELGIATPVNQTLHALVKVLELLATDKEDTSERQ
ncbi:MAG TPA: 2-dehydropantoate 2-reductase [Gemmataceae bacterium]|nr:2-dehydropantoate 2-reductase [Gemmataceae bacterium]